MSKLKELVEWWNNEWVKTGTPKGDTEIINKARSLLAEEAEQKPVEESVEGLCGTCNGSGMVQIGPNIRGMKTCETCKGKGKIAGHRPVKDEPLEELAKRKNKIVNKPIVICERDFFNERVFYKESEARAYLNGLDDKGAK